KNLVRHGVLQAGRADRGEHRPVTRGLCQYIVPLDRIAGVSAWSSDKRGLALAGSIHNHAGWPCFRILSLQARIRADADLRGERSERWSHKRRRAGTVHEALRS